MRFLSVLALIILTTPFFAGAVSVYIDPAEVSYGPGDTFVATIRVDNQGECINAAEVAITYPKQLIRAADFSRGNSIFSLWVEEPRIDTELGVVAFSGGIPGGYCGRIPGDPALTNVLGKVVFTVLGAEGEASIRVAPTTRAYLNDGLGTAVPVETSSATVTLLKEAKGGENPWLLEVGDDVIPPDPFVVEVASTRDVFGGRYYIVFSTVDKQSGLDHFEIFERGQWKTITSPYELRDQSLRGIQVRAIDKAGNERLGDYVEGSAPPRQTPPPDYRIFAFIGFVLLIGASYSAYSRTKKRSS